MMMRTVSPLWPATALAAALLAPRGDARADTCVPNASGAIDVTHPAKGNGVVEIENIAGSVKVVGWGHNEVRSKGSLDTSCHLDVSPSSDRVRVRVLCPRGHHADSSADLEILVPIASSVEVRTMSADIGVRDVTGALRVESVSGDVTIAGAPSEINARTTSGELSITAASPVTHARSVSGDIHVRGARGRASVESVSGECQLIGGEFTEAEMRSVSGELLFDGAFSGQGSFELKSHSGEVTIRVPAASTNADFELRSFSGELSTTFGATRTANAALDFRAGSGGAKVRVRTFSGDVTVEGKK